MRLQRHDEPTTGGWATLPIDAENGGKRRPDYSARTPRSHQRPEVLGRPLQGTLTSRLSERLQGRASLLIPE